MPRLAPLALTLALIGPPPATATADDRRPDLVVADFEGDAYGPGWHAEGTAFGAGPARGALPGQMSVEGFEGGGLVNSFLGGDDAEGALTSPPFRVERRYINFLLGGGRDPDLLQVALVVDGRPVRTATGPNDRPGGSERLAWATWDVADLAGKAATLRVVDRRRGGWGHINLDQVVQSDARRQAEPATRTLAPSARYLHLPVRTANPVRRVRIADAEGKVVRDFDIRLDDGPGNIFLDDRGRAPILAAGRENLETTADGQTVRAADGRPLDSSADFMAFLDVESFWAQDLTITADPPGPTRALEGVTVSDHPPGGDHPPVEADRPRFHFTSRRGWLNDPNGLVYHKGLYHLFYQHNPYGWDWGNMHWGHAVSSDLVRWRAQPEALYPQRYGDWCFSGSAVVDRANTSGFGTAANPPLVAAYTSTGRGECIVWSTDEGKTWAEFAGNPVVKHNGRDPRLFWHEPTRRWVMAVYDEGADGKARAIDFHTSPDLKAWTAGGRIDGFFECPDLFELPVEGANPPRSLWVLSAADGRYRLGRFDGRDFTPESDLLTLWHGDFYAAQTFSDTPDGRRIQIGWARGIDFPGMPFNQQMTIPTQLTLRQTPDGPRLHAEPVAELATLAGASWSWGGPEAGRDDLGTRSTKIEAVEGVDLTVTAEGEAMGAWTAKFGGAAVSYDPAKGVVDLAGLAVPLAPESGRITVRILADRRSLELFGNGGRVAASRHIARKPGAPALEVTTTAGAADRSRTLRVELHTLRSAW